MQFSIKTILAVAAVLTVPANAFFRMPCGGNLVVERIDPLVDPGVVAAHVHQVTGGNAFGFTLDYPTTQESTCTTCTASQDHSNYWTPIIYYQDEDTLEYTALNQSGMTVYYEQRGNLTDILAFPEGFRMLAGDPYKRNATDDFASEAISFVCLDYAGTSDQYRELPTTACPDGLRAQVYFPACWDGVHLDSPDHKSHVSYYATGEYDTGVCPTDYPVQLIGLFYEVIFDTSTVAWWNGSFGTGQPFVLSNGDATGNGWHGDFIMGWESGVLQEAVDTCTNDVGTMEDCTVLLLQNDTAMADCTIPVSIAEDIVGPMADLPGCNPVTAGPEEATAVTDCDADSTIVGPIIPFTDVTSDGWAYLGCAPDNVDDRTLTGTSNIYSTDQDDTTLASCITFCAGYTYMGLEDGKQCFCGNTITPGGEPQVSVLGNCDLSCTGNSSEYCGGASELTLYESCGNLTSCTNVPYVAIGNLVGGLGNTTVASTVATSAAVAATSSAAAAATSSAAAAAGSAAATTADGSASSAEATGSGAASTSPAASTSSAATAVAAAEVVQTSSTSSTAEATTSTISGSPAAASSSGTSTASTSKATTYTAAAAGKGEHFDYTVTVTTDVLVTTTDYVTVYVTSAPARKRFEHAARGVARAD